MRLHEDEDFQQDANDPSIEPALDIMRADPRAMEQYEGNARMMRVLHKLRSFQVITITIVITVIVTTIIACRYPRHRLAYQKKKFHNMCYATYSD